MRRSGVFILTVLLLTGSLQAQGTKSSWQRSPERVKSGLHLFHSQQVINLPTAETMQKSNFEFEISHRFIPPIKAGFETLYGLDGPVNMRLGLGYAVTDRLILTLARSNVLDNVDLSAKYRFLEHKHELLPLMAAVKGGLAWTTEDIFGRSRTDGRNFQYYAFVVLNTMIKDRVGLGITPGYLYNSDIFSEDYEDVFVLGSYIQLYVSHLLSLMMEWSPVLSDSHLDHNAASMGIELETGGHFFKIFAGNSTMLNPSQYMPGAVDNFQGDQLRLGFMITRLLKL